MTIKWKTKTKMNMIGLLAPIVFKVMWFIQDLKY